MASIDAACEHGTRRQRDRDLGQAQLFGGSAAHDAGAESDERAVAVAPWTEAEQLAYEKESLGLYWTGHPIDRVAAELRAFGARTTADLAAAASENGAQAAGNGVNGGQTRSGALRQAQGVPSASRDGLESRGETDVSVGGIVSACRQLKTRKGDRMAVITLEDPHGSVEVVVFPETYGRSSSLLEVGKAVVVRGKVERDEEADTARILASDVLPLEAMRERMTRELSIRLTVPPHGRATFEALADLFASHRGDRRVVFELELRGRDRPLRVRAEVASPIRIRPSDQLASEVERICGAGTVSLR
jgi:DNA polymerase-3 subunit alpha